MLSTYLTSLRVDLHARDAIAESSVFVHDISSPQVVDQQGSVLWTSCDVIGVGRKWHHLLQAPVHVVLKLHRASINHSRDSGSRSLSCLKSKEDLLSDSHIPELDAITNSVREKEIIRLRVVLVTVLNDLVEHSWMSVFDEQTAFGLVHVKYFDWLVRTTAKNQI